MSWCLAAVFVPDLAGETQLAFCSASFDIDMVAQLCIVVALRCWEAKYWLVNGQNCSSKADSALPRSSV